MKQTSELKKYRAYRSIKLKEIQRKFSMRRNGQLWELKYSRGRNPINIVIPFVLDEDVAILAGLMPDGSLIKDLRRIYFHQKKDLSKLYLFKEILHRKFGVQNKVFIREGCNVFEAYSNSQTLARFLYELVNFSKSDESMRVPKWIFNSPESVKNVYLREVFAMEGSILRNHREIRMISKDKEFALDLQKLLDQVKITSTVRPRIGGTPPGRQYRLAIYGKVNFSEFRKIGFSLKSHRERFESWFPKQES
tara:strand:+ start:2202 stop:2951 length:750 start_codon:yes stop_codon:yes gene_type:complete